MSGRAAPYYCPYCGDEDLRPAEAAHGAWECRACNRAFRLSFLGLLARGTAPSAPAQPSAPGQPSVPAQPSVSPQGETS